MKTTIDLAGAKPAVLTWERDGYDWRLHYNGRYIGKAWENIGGYIVGFDLRNAEGVFWGFAKNISIEKVKKEVRAALKAGFTAFTAH